VAAVGEATASAARKAGLQVAFVPEAYVAESLVEGLLQSLQNQASSQRILIARAAVARDVIPDALCSAGAAVDVVDAYRNVLPEAAPRQLCQALQNESTRPPHQLVECNEFGRSCPRGWYCMALCRCSGRFHRPHYSQTLRSWAGSPRLRR